MFAVMLLCGSYKLFAQGRKLMWNFIKVYVLLVLNCLSPPWAFCWTGLCLFINVYGIALRLTIQRWITRSGTGGRLLSVSGPTVVPVTDYGFSSYRQPCITLTFYWYVWLISSHNWPECGSPEYIPLAFQYNLPRMTWGSMSPVGTSSVHCIRHDILHLQHRSSCNLHQW